MRLPPPRPPQPGGGGATAAARGGPPPAGGGGGGGGEPMDAAGRGPSARRHDSGAAEAGEIAEQHAADECLPFGRRELKHRATRVAAIPDANIPGTEIGDLDTVAVGVAERGLDPRGTRLLLGRD